MVQDDNHIVHLSSCVMTMYHQEQSVYDMQPAYCFIIFFYASRLTHKAWKATLRCWLQLFLSRGRCHLLLGLKHCYPFYSPYGCRLGYHQSNTNSSLYMYFQKTCSVMSVYWSREKTCMIWNLFCFVLDSFHRECWMQGQDLYDGWKKSPKFSCICDPSLDAWHWSSRFVFMGGNTFGNSLG